MPTQYIPDVDFKAQVKELKAELRSIDEHMRWVVVPVEGAPYILRPDSTNPNAK